MTQTPAGWYADPDPSSTGSGRLRYWDGQQWTEHLHDAAPPVQPEQPAEPVPLPTYPTYPGTPEPQPYGAAAPAAYGQEYGQGYGQPYGQYPPQPAYGQYPATPDGQRLAGWWQRVLATVVDFFIQLPLLLLAATPVVVSQWDELTAWVDDLSYAAENGTTDPPIPALFDLTTTAGLSFVLLMLAGSVLYSVVFLRWKQGTPGKLALGLRVRRRDVPGPLPWGTIALRVGFVTGLSLLSNLPIAGILVTLVVLLDALWPLWDGKKQALHDKVAGTNVVRIR